MKWSYYYTFAGAVAAVSGVILFFIKESDVGMIASIALALTGIVMLHVSSLQFSIEKILEKLEEKDG